MQGRTLKPYLAMYHIMDKGKRRTLSCVVQAYNKTEARNAVYASVKAGIGRWAFNIIVSRIEYGD